ncbi:MAG TPA: acyl-CoA dehydrogenase family protein [Streptosporangiaceae bacterium]
MDFAETESQAELAGLARKILTEQVTPERLAAAEAGPDRFDAALWADLAGAGVLAAALPEELGGAGLGFLDACSVLIELGRAVAPVPYLASIVLGAGAVARFGSAAQQEEFAVPAGRGELILTAALAEEDGDDPAAPSARAERSAAGGWVLSGVKTTVPAAPLAALLLVPAATPDGVAVFLVRPGDAGVTVARQQVTSGDSTGRVVLDGVRVGADRVLGEPGGEAGAAGWLLRAGTVGLCATAAGVTARALELTAEYARERIQFGKPIGGFQAVAQRLADAYIDCEAIRLTMWQAAWRLAEGLPCAAEIATAKFWAADAGHRVAHTAVHVHGGVGIDLSHPAHRYFTAAKHCEFMLGGATVQLLRLGAELAAAGG